jgi:hypothetical protein
MSLYRKNRSASGRAALNPAAASRGWSGVKRPVRLAFRTTKLLGRHEAASPKNRPQALLQRFLALFEILMAIDQPY